MATPSTMTDLSVTAASNSPAGSESPTNGDDFLRAIQAIVRRTNAKGSDIASATTTDIGAATAEFVDITGTTTITSLGTIDAGIVRTVRFTGALTLTYNATSLILPGAANITTASGDTAEFRSLGSGNWICTQYKRQSGVAISAPYLPLAGGTVTGATTFSNDVYINGGTLRLSKGADVASATALPLITDGNYFDVTGTTTITSFNSMGVGTQIVLHFDAALTLTHNATDLILPSGANITTAAGDEAGFIEYASGDWRCVFYTKANGRAITSAFSSTYTSSETSLPAANTTASATHGLGAVPFSWSVVLRCTTTEFGYAVGDEIDVTTVIDGDGARCTSTWANSTTIGYQSTQTAPTVKNRASAGSTPLTAANWRLVFRAWL